MYLRTTLCIFCAYLCLLDFCQISLSLFYFFYGISVFISDPSNQLLSCILELSFFRLHVRSASYFIKVITVSCPPVTIATVQIFFTLSTSYF